MSYKRNFGIAAALAVGMLYLLPPATAATIYKATTSGNLDATSSWYTTEAGPTNPGSIGTSDTLWFGGSGQGGDISGASLGSDLPVGAVRLDNVTGTPNYNVTIASGNTLTLNGNNDYSGSYLSGIVLDNATGGTLTINSDILVGASQRWISSRALTIGGNVNTNGNTLTFWSASSGAITVSGNISGTGGNLVYQYGSSAVNLNGTLSGSVGLAHQQNAGTLSIGGTTTSGYSGAISLGGASGGTFKVASGATLVTTGSFSTSWNKTITVDGTLTVGNASITTNATTPINGTGTFSVATMGVANHATVSFGGSGTTFNDSGSFFLGNAWGQKGNWTQTDGTVNLTGGNDTIRFGHWGGGATGTYSLSGGTLNAKNSDTVIGWDGSGTLSVSGGTANLRGIRMGNTAANGNHNGAGTITLTGGRLNLGTGGISAGGSGAKTITLGPGTMGAYANWSSSQAMTLAATKTVTFDTADSVTASARTITLSGPLTGSGALAKAGVGSLVLSGNNGYSGGTSIGAGEVRVSTNDTALGTGAVTFTGNALLATASGGGARNLANDVTVNSGVTASLDGGYADLTLSGDIGGAGSVLKVSTGNVILSGTNTYGGTTGVNNGTLLVNGTHTGGGAYTVAAGAILGGSGSTASDVTVTGIISPGTSIGTLGVGNTTIDGNYLLEADTSGASDLLNVTGLLTLNSGSSVLDLDASSSLNPSLIYTIASYTTLSGVFNTVDSAILATHNVDYLTGNQIRLVPVPEPGSFALLLFGAGAFWAAGRKRRAK